jgi:hypothetical protein
LTTDSLNRNISNPWVPAPYNPPMGGLHKPSRWPAQIDTKFSWAASNCNKWKKTEPLCDQIAANNLKTLTNPILPWSWYCQWFIKRVYEQKKATKCVLFFGG